MSEPSLVLQAALRALLVNAEAVTNLVLPANIIDQSERPERFPCVIIGEDQTLDDTRELSPSIALSEVIQTLHVFSRSEGLVECKRIAGAIQRTVRRTKFDVSDDPNVLCLECWFEGSRFLRDPDGITAHGVITLRGRVQEPWRTPA